MTRITDIELEELAEMADDELTSIEEPGHIGNARCAAKDLADEDRRNEYARELIENYRKTGRIS